MPDSPALTPSPTYFTKPPHSPLPSSITQGISPSTRRIEIWRREVASATLLHPTPPLPAPQGTWRRLEKRIRGRIWTGKANGKNGKGGPGKGNAWLMDEEEERPEPTRMYVLSEREEATRRLEAKAEECSWDVEGGKETEGSSGGGEKRRGVEKDARLERAAELLMRQRRVALREEEEVMGERMRVVV
ncbi:hypothetical protein VE03_08919 [Pseudogymnoascus sp. 23342-1-I1]|nr:hypothetical protein VE03_08919 [Pseudogymnoascus sp. 23342-1-I1]